MKFWVGVTDQRWFDFNRARGFDEVNFWQPSQRAPFKTAIPEGAPFLFKLKSPVNAIAGGGFYSGTLVLPISVAWEVFGAANGAASLDDFRSLIAPLSGAHGLTREIVCQAISDPVFLPPEHWLRTPPGFAGNIVTGRSYDSGDPAGAIILAHALPWLRSPPLTTTPAGIAAEPPGPKWGAPVTVRPRLRQGAFRMRLFEAYDRRCAITGESTLPTLDAAHIVPYAEQHSSHDVTNGLLLRSDFHRLFDHGLVTVEPDLTIRISPRIREAWYNGKAYYRLEGQRLAVVPTRREWRPDPERLRWHNAERFQR